MAESVDKKKKPGDPGKWSQVKKTLNDFADWTSAHGVPHVASADKIWLKIFWLAAILAAAAFFISNLHNMITRYFNYETSVQTQLHFEKRAFPSVTICPLDTAASGPDFEALNAAFSTRRMSTGQGNTNGTGQNGNADVFKFDQHHENMEAHALIWAQMLMHRGNTEQNTTREFNKVITNCAYNTKPCFERNFLRYFDTKFGTCYVFNPDGELQSSRAGPLYGLRLLVRLSQKAYAPHVKNAGARVAVHEANLIPMKKDNDFGAVPNSILGKNGVLAAPGFSTSVGVRYVQNDHLPAPHGDCTEGGAGTPYNEKYPDIVYEANACRSACVQEAIIQDCGCFTPLLGYEKSVDSCAMGDLEVVAEKIDCMQKVMGAFDEQSCQCPVNCSVGKYELTVSSTVFPSEVYKPAECTKPDKDHETCMKWYRRNTLMLEVFYERINFQRIYEVKDFELVNLFSDIGGQVGLWLGMSIITCVEFLCLILLLCGVGVKGCKHKSEGENGGIEDAYSAAEVATQSSRL